MDPGIMSFRRSLFALPSEVQLLIYGGLRLPQLIALGDANPLLRRTIVQSPGLLRIANVDVEEDYQILADPRSRNFLFKELNL